MPQASSPQPESALRHWPKVVLSVAIAGAFVWLLRRGALPLVPPREAFAQVNGWWVAAYALLWSTLHVVRAGRWYWLLAAVQRVPMLTVLRSAFIGFVAIVVLPFRTGEVVRPLLIRREGRLTAWAASGTVAAERIIDGLCISGLLLVALTLAKPIEPLPDHIGNLSVPAKLVPGAAYATVTLFIAAFTVMALFYWRREWARRMTLTALGLASPKLAHWLAGRVEQVAEGLTFLRQPQFSGPFLVGTLLYWGMNALSWWVLAQACGLTSLTLLQACATMGVLALGILIPNAPGYFGAFQLSIYAGLAMYLPSEEVVGPGAVYVFLNYVLQIGITLAFGALGTLVPARSDAGRGETTLAS